MLRRTYIGLDIRADGLNAVALQRRSHQLVLAGHRHQELPQGTLEARFREPNVRQPLPFVEALKSVLTPLLKGDRRIAVALPDQAGQLYLLELDTPFKNRHEAAELIRWQLKDQLPDKISHKVVLDYQILEHRESGQKRILAAVISADVLAQYEALLEQAGFAPEIIDFHALALYNAYRERVDLGRDFILIGVDGRQFSLQCFVNRMLVFSRQRQVDDDPGQIFQEVNRSLAALAQVNYPLNRLMTVHLHSDRVEREQLLSAIAAAFEQPVGWLSFPLVGLRPELKDQDSCRFVAALGIAERAILRVTR